MSYYTVRYYFSNKENSERWEIDKVIDYSTYSSLDLFKVKAFFCNEETYLEINLCQLYVVDALKTAMEYFINFYKENKMTKMEQATSDYLKSLILPVLNGYIGDDVNPETVDKMEDELITVLKSHMIQHNWEVIVDE